MKDSYGLESDQNFWIYFPKKNSADKYIIKSVLKIVLGVTSTNRLAPALLDQWLLVPRIIRSVIVFKSIYVSVPRSIS